MSKILDKVYSYLPVGLQNVVISIFGYLWQKRRFGGVFNEKLKEFKEREFFTKEQWKDYQNRQLKQLLINAFDNVPLYTEKYSNAGFSRADLEKITIDTLHHLPLLEKNEVREFGKTSMLNIKKDPDGKFYASSGSTGTPVNIYLSKKTHQIWTAAYEIRVKNWAGVSKEMVRGMIGGRRILPNAKLTLPVYRLNYFERMVYFSAYHIMPDSITNYLRGIKKHKVDFMMGYAMSNFLLAKFIKENKLSAPKLKAVITSSEKLTSEMRDTFQEVYKCDSFDTWSGVEACAQISECQYHSLHESPDIGIIELIDSNDKIIDTGMGEAICTSLINFDQPLIRYRCGDLLSLSQEQVCSCGRKMKVYDEIIGRLEDIVIGPDGRQMVRFHGVFINIPSIIKSQVIQHEVNHVEIRLKLTKPLTQDEEFTIINRMKSQLGDIHVQLVFTDDFIPGSNGKHKAVISNIK